MYIHLCSDRLKWRRTLETGPFVRNVTTHFGQSKQENVHFFYMQKPKFRCITNSSSPFFCSRHNFVVFKRDTHVFQCRVHSCVICLEAQHMKHRWYPATKGTLRGTQKFPANVTHTSRDLVNGGGHTLDPLWTPRDHFEPPRSWWLLNFTTRLHLVNAFHLSYWIAPNAFYNRTLIGK